MSGGCGVSCNGFLTRSICHVWTRTSGTLVHRGTHRGAGDLEMRGGHLPPPLPRPAPPPASAVLNSAFSPSSVISPRAVWCWTLDSLGVCDNHRLQSPPRTVSLQSCTRLKSECALHRGGIYTSCQHLQSDNIFTDGCF